jgi:beta-lactamase superfamily II metal-dependent hydrolase
MVKARNKTKDRNKLRVRVYNVRFGDAILVSVPERQSNGSTETRHMLIDVGNAQAGEGGADTVFEPIVRDILSELGGEPLDLYVMTHEHLDHVQGLFFASVQHGLDLKARSAWITASADPNYYANGKHPDAKKKLDLFVETFDRIERYLGASPASPNPLLATLLLNNNPRSTGECVEYLRKLADQTTYVFRGCELDGTHPFREAKLRLWGPEEDTSSYYGSFQPMALEVTSQPAGVGDTDASPILPEPPSGVDAGAFYDLVDMRRRGFVDNLLAIDKAANNTSIVFTLEWRGWKLLFPGDAESRSWKEMNKRRLLEEVDFLKVGHHGSHNGTPPIELLNKILPFPARADRRPRAVVSTCSGAYNNVPDTDTMDELRRRCDLYSVEDLPPDKPYLDLFFEG